MDIVGFLRTTDLFYDLSDAQLSKVAADCRNMTYAAGELIFAEDSPSVGLFVVVRGEVEVSIRFNIAIGSMDDDRSGGDQIVLATFSPGQCFGEIGMIDQGVRSATSKSVRDDTLLIEIDSNKLMQQCEVDTDMGFKIMRHIARALTLRVRKLDLELHGQIFWGSGDTDLSKLF